MTQRIYRVINTQTAAEHLVRAHSQAQAIRHVVSHEYRAAARASGGGRSEDGGMSADTALLRRQLDED